MDRIEADLEIWGISYHVDYEATYRPAVIGSTVESSHPSESECYVISAVASETLADDEEIPDAETITQACWEHYLNTTQGLSSF